MSWNPTVGATRRGPKRGGGPWFPLILGGLLLFGGAFVFGYQLAYRDADRIQVGLQSLQRERDRLREALARIEERAARLERAHLIDREARRVSLDQLKELQDERLALVRQVTYLERMVRDGAVDALRIRDFVLEATDESGVFAYGFTLDRSIGEFGESAGRALLKLKGRRANERVNLSSADLPGSEPTAHKILFNHSSRFDGVLVVPSDLEPEAVIIEIEPETRYLASSSETFPWAPLNAAAETPETPPDPNRPGATDSGSVDSGTEPPTVLD